MENKQKDFALYCALGTLLEEFGEDLALAEHEQARLIEIAEELEEQTTPAEMMALVIEMARESVSKLLSSQEGREC
ncbi:hypothetical protein [Paenibacillus dendritiformis]|uniref:hypothetical protein n=1 Tax=Paenibacillus dendritiformis TaxID=130049 RepID=UPI00387E1187